MSSSTLIDLSSVRVLCVDGNAVMRSVMRTSLLRRGCREVVQAHGAMDALDLCAGRTFELIICDYYIAPMNGLDFLRALSNSGLGTGWPVIMLVAEADARFVGEAMAHGISATVTRPVSMRELIERIDGVLRRRGHGGPGQDGDPRTMEERYQVLLIAALTSAEHVCSSLMGRASEAVALAHSLRGIIDAAVEHARVLGFDLILSLGLRAGDLLAAMARDPAAAVRWHAEASHALNGLITAMKQIARNRLRGDPGEPGQRLLRRIDTLVAPVLVTFAGTRPGRSAGPAR